MLASSCKQNALPRQVQTDEQTMQYCYVHTPAFSACSVLSEVPTVNASGNGIYLTIMIFHVSYQMHDYTIT